MSGRTFFFTDDFLFFSNARIVAFPFFTPRFSLIFSGSYLFLLLALLHSCMIKFAICGQEINCDKRATRPASRLHTHTGLKSP